MITGVLSRWSAPSYYGDATSANVCIVRCSIYSCAPDDNNTGIRIIVISN